MKAIVVHQFGGPEVLKMEDVPKPEPKEDEILVKVIAAGVNSFDGGLRSGKWAKSISNRPISPRVITTMKPSLERPLCKIP